MCGISGYVGPGDAAAIVRVVLEDLEHRGYDSSGIAVQGSKTLEVEKAVGRPGNLVLRFTTSSGIAIGHNRWATHGGVTDNNAHPHRDCSKNIAVVHNGIIDNYEELKAALLQKGHIFSSETDTEVVAHLLEDASKDLPLVQAVAKVFGLLRGSNAIVAMNNTTKEIVAAKNGSPLVVGIGDNKYFIASDAAGLGRFTREVVFINDNELVSLNSAMHVYNLADMQERTPTIETLPFDFEQVKKGNFSYFMLKEIYEQCSVVERNSQRMASELHAATALLTNAPEIFLVGCGTAYHAGLVAKYLFSKIAKRNVHLAAASEFAVIEDFVANGLLVALSQSGETIDIIDAMRGAKDKGAATLALINAPGSTLSRLSDQTLMLGAGVEKAVASTKAYMAKIALLSLLAYSMAGKEAEGRQLLLDSAQEIERLLTKASVAKVKRIAAKLKRKRKLFAIGRAISFPTALEGALKIKEISGIHAEGLPGGELKHGPIALIKRKERTPCIVLAPLDETYEAIISNAEEVKARGGYIIGISPKNASVFDEWIDVRDIGLSPLTQIVPMQLLAYFLAVYNGLNPDMPENLAKTVTVR